MDQNQLAVKLFDHHSDEYMEKYFNVDLYAESLDVLLELLPAQASVLDLAAGPGNVARYLLNRSPELKCTVTDLSPRMTELARKNVPEGEVLLLDCRDVRKLEKDFDSIICSFCIPYLSLPEVEKLILDCREKLSQNGVLYLSFILRDKDESELSTASSGLQLYMHYYALKTIVALLERDFEILHHQTYVSYNQRDRDVVLIAGEKQAGRG